MELKKMRRRFDVSIKAAGMRLDIMAHLSLHTGEISYTSWRQHCYHQQRVHCLNKLPLV